MSAIVKQPTNAAVVTPSNTITFEPSLIYMGASGNIRVTLEGAPLIASRTLIFSPPAGSILPFKVIRVWSTNTILAGGGSIIRLF